MLRKVQDLPITFLGTHSVGICSASGKGQSLHCVGASMAGVTSNMGGGTSWSAMSRCKKYLTLSALRCKLFLTH